MSRPVYFDLLEIDKFRHLGLEGQGIKIAVFDKGVQKHTDLNIVGGFNAHNQSESPFDFTDRHGTMVAGIINSELYGVVPEAEIYSVKIDDGSKNDKNAQIAGLQWAIDNNIDIINCSFSNETDSLDLHNAYKQAYESGIIIVCSSGNRQNNVDDLQDVMRAPARYDFTVSVGNINIDLARTATSCVGKHLNLSSYGVNVTSTTIDSTEEISDKYATGSGTSYSAATITGLFALYKQMFPNDSNKKIIERMLESAESIGNPWKYGAGIPKFPKKYNNIQMKHRVG